MVSVYHDGAEASSFAYDASVHTDTLEQDLSAELGRDNVVPHPQQKDRQPLRTALSAIRINLDQRMREWRGSAKVVEQSLRQLVAAEQARSEALSDLQRIEAEVAHSGGVVTQALAAFDEDEDIRDIDPLFERSQQALDELESAAGELSIAQEWCRSAAKQYAEALRREQVLRLYIQSPSRLS
ncbi:hypothetical protein IZ6_23790 [Terrihabitans soli]|uniref:Uncharacterized protein n=1 Tax=Terrihabitans soli TaxID=708113 RepID=A0A6S6QMF9_9HYPH|nr:hypothetical protein [Terrihabitans soli]BCJ91644.1 hypothetical protein IZ6_23790 [Terrihabitans soli]